jgi:FkbM family methyltransferase
MKLRPGCLPLVLLLRGLPFTLPSGCFRIEIQKQPHKNSQLNTALFEKLNKVERLAKGPKIGRFLQHPAKYILALGWRHMVQRFRIKGLTIKTKTFWNETFIVELPAATDIFLTGGKSDDSELRLAKFMIRTLKPGDHVIDVGSHFGYYSCLALQLTGQEGKLISLEPSDTTFRILKLNLNGRENGTAIKAMAGSKSGLHRFYQFPNLYSEFNTAHPDQFKHEEWFKKTIPHASVVHTLTIDEIVDEYKLAPCFIKIDTEGSEMEVISGAIGTLNKFPGLILAMEFLSKARSNHSHEMAAGVLEENGFHSFVIRQDGTLDPCNDLEHHLWKNKIDSDNIIFQKV